MSRILKLSDNKWLHFALIAGAIFIAYAKVMHAPFIMSWDDDEYIVRNNDIHSIGAANIKKWFSGFYVGNYAPLTMLSYAINFCFSRLDTFAYHITNIVLHFFNACLVYSIIKKVQGNSLIALFTALLFALNPIQVEAVSWLSERKTLLCAFFYLSALLAYVHYILRPDYRKLAIVFLLGLLALLSKPMAIVLAPAMFAVDVWMGRSLNKRNIWLEKIPFFILSLIFGIVAIKGEAQANFLSLHPEYSGWKTFPIAAEAYCRYIIHLLAPVHLSIYYPYPEYIGPLQYAYFALAFALLILLLVAWRKGWSILSGGLLFYSINIGLVLQFVQMSPFLMSDHYNYISMIGITFPIVYYTVSRLQEAGQQPIALAGFGAIAILLLFATYNYNDIWRSELDLSNSLLNDYPGSPVAHATTGALYINNGDFEQAGIHLNKAVKLDPHNYKAWYNKGVLEFRTGKVKDALASFNHCLSLNAYEPAYFSRAVLYVQTGKLPEALADAEKTLETQPDNARAWYIKGYCLERRDERTTAIDCYTTAIKLDNSEALFYKRRGICLANSGNYGAALADIDKSISLDPGSGEAFYYRGAIKYNLKTSPCPDLKTAAAKGYSVPPEVLQQMCK